MALYGTVHFRILKFPLIIAAFSDLWPAARLARTGCPLTQAHQARESKYGEIWRNPWWLHGSCGNTWETHDFHGKNVIFMGQSWKTCDFHGETNIEKGINYHRCGKILGFPNMICKWWAFHI